MKFLSKLFKKAVKETPSYKEGLNEGKNAAIEPSYIELALRTENKDWQAIAKRLEENSEEVMEALNNAILAAQQLDYVVKKQCYYGKPPKKYEAPLFPLVLDEKQKAILHTEAFVRYLHSGMGILTESGEILEALSKQMKGENLNIINIYEELGDVFWYSAIMADEGKTTFKAEQKKNIAKLAKRYGDKFSDFLSVNRDLDAERKILEKKH